ncbi:Ctr copper transporter family-domain-containing protein [Astrocystis sublimbata]|nr:Ctr copper transporter family-domain-containing protein [Astrocystis sublimbata]
MDHSHMDHSGMDHSGMDHGGMDHGGMDHGGHGGGSMPMCNMNMLFTWDTTNLCIVFRQWHVTGTASLIFSLLAIVAICAGYEALREGTRRYEVWLSNKEVAYNRYQENAAANHHHDHDPEQGEEEQVAETTPFLGIERISGGSGSGSGPSEPSIGQRARILKAVLYAVQNFYAFMIMLLFMTYNGFVMIAVAVGAGLGYYFFGSHTRATKETACH